MSDLGDRIGHLSEMAFDKLKLDPPESDPSWFEAARAHLASCDGCRAAFDAMRAEDDAFALPPAARVREALTAPAPATAIASEHVSEPGRVTDLEAARAARAARLNRIAAGATATLAIAATLFIVTRPSTTGIIDQPDAREILTPRGGKLDFEVHVHDGTKSRLVEDGGVVHPGERAGFGVRASEDGYLLVFGWDATGAPYAAHPTGDDLAAIRAPAIEATPEPITLQSAIRFDDLLGDEHLAAVWCQNAFMLSDVIAPRGSIDASALTASAARRDCVVRHVVLHKVARAP